MPLRRWKSGQSVAQLLPAALPPKQAQRPDCMRPGQRVRKHKQRACSAGLSTTQLPAARAGATCWEGAAAGRGSVGGQGRRDWSELHSTQQAGEQTGKNLKDNHKNKTGLPCQHQQREV